MLRRRRWLGAVIAFALPFALAVPVAAATDTLLGGEALTAGQSLVSGDNHYVLTLQSDGNLVLEILDGLSPGRVLWQTGTAGDLGDRLEIQDDGNAVLYNADNQALWSSNTSTAGCANLVVQEDGNLVLYNAAHAVWSSHTLNTYLRPGDNLRPGERIFSYDERYELAMQSDGNLVLYGPTGPLWSPGVTAAAGNFLSMHTTGDLVESSATHKVLFKSATYTKGSFAHLQVDGNFVVYGPDSTALWSTGTNAKRPKGTTTFPRPAFQACPPPPPPPPPPTSPPSDPVVLVPKTTTFPKLRLKNLKIRMSWVWRRQTTRLHKMSIEKFPHNATINFSCKGKGCPHHRFRDRADWRQLGHLIRSFNGRYYRAGDTLTIMITERHFRPERIVVSIRWGRLPRIRQL